MDIFINYFFIQFPQGCVVVEHIKAPAKACKCKVIFSFLYGHVPYVTGRDTVF